MAKNSKIEWTHHTANLWFGCTQVHIGCDNCYALAFSKRVGNDIWGNDKPRRLIKDVWENLKKYQKNAENLGEIHRVFVGSMQDIFEKPMPLVDHKGNPYVEGEDEFWDTGQLREKFFNEVVPNSPNLMFLLLTKRPSNINKYIPESWKTNPPKNIMFGTSPVNQETAEKLIVQLSKVNGKRFLSIEPQLEKIDLMAKANDGTERVLLDTVDWVINGGESGHHKRPFDTEWARIIRDDCDAKGVPFFFKQIDKIQAIPEDLMIREFPLYGSYFFETCQIAYDKLIYFMNNDDDFDWDSIGQIDFWLKEFLRGNEEDIDWMNAVVNAIGHECYAVKQWFLFQSDYPELWPKKCFKIIKGFSNILTIEY